MVEEQFLTFARFCLFLVLILNYPTSVGLSFFVGDEASPIYRLFHTFIMLPASLFGIYVLHRFKGEALIVANSIMMTGIMSVWLVGAIYLKQNPDGLTYYIYIPLTLLYLLQLAVLYASFPNHTAVFYLIYVLITILGPALIATSEFQSQSGAFVSFIVGASCVFVYAKVMRKVFVNMKTQRNAERVSHNKLVETQFILNSALSDSPIGLVCFDAYGKLALRQNFGALEMKFEYFEDQASFQTQLEKLFRVDSHALDLRAAHIQIDGSYYMISKKAAQGIDVYVFVDVSERHEWEASLRQSQKLQVVGELTSGIAHDYNNILAIAINNLDAFPKDTSAQLWESYLQPVHEALIHAKSVSRKLLTLAGKRHLNKSVICLGTAVKELKKVLQPALEPRIRLEIDVQENIHILSDPDELSAAILNIVINAKNAIGDKAGVVRIEVYSDEDKAVISIQDNGSGIPEHLRENIFDPFFTTKIEHYSTGLGLSMVKGFMEQSDGMVDLVSCPGFTKFTLNFPLHCSGEVEKEERAETKEPMDQQQYPVLVVDDNPQLLKSMQRIFEHLKWPGDFAQNAIAAQDALKQRPELSTAFLDLSMPDMDGIALGKILMKQNPKLRCFLLTGHASEDLIDEAKEAGFVAVLFKPIQVSALMEITQGQTNTDFSVIS